MLAVKEVQMGHLVMWLRPTGAARLGAEQDRDSQSHH